jgi:hypothetical protein
VEGPLFVIERSAFCAVGQLSAVVTLIWLFVARGSGVSLLMKPVFVTDDAEHCPCGTGAVNVTEISGVLWLEATVGMVQRSSLAMTEQLAPDEDTNWNPAGIGSRITTLVAAVGPLLIPRRMYVSESPYCALVGPALIMERSALFCCTQFTTVLTVLVLLVETGSALSALTVATFWIVVVVQLWIFGIRNVAVIMADA